MQNLAAYWWGSDGAVEEAALAMEVQPPDSLLRLRAQCESQSKQQQLYAKKPDNWLEVRAAVPLPDPHTSDGPLSLPLFGRSGTRRRRRG